MKTKSRYKTNRVLLIGGNFAPEPTGIGRYNGEMIHWLATHGYQCTVITTSPYYPQWQVAEGYSNRRYQKEIIPTTGEPITVYRCPHYIPSSPTGKMRILSDLSFSISTFFQLVPFLFTRKYDHVIAVVPPFHIGVHAWLYKLLKGARFYYHVQDLQIEAARDLQMIRSKLLLSLMFSLERFVMNRADVVSTISGGMLKRVKQKTKTKTVLFSNWVDTDAYFPLAMGKMEKSIFGFKDDDIIILYSGAIGEKQGIEMILESATNLQDHYRLKFAICGTGPYKEKLAELCRQRQLANVVFLPLQPASHFNRFLNMAAVHLVLQKAGAADLVMPSKLTTILAVGGLSIVTAEEGTSLYEVVNNNGLGFTVIPGDQHGLDAAILTAALNDNSQMKERARRYAVQEWSINKVIPGYIKNF